MSRPMSPVEKAYVNAKRQPKRGVRWNSLGTATRARLATPPSWWTGNTKGILKKSVRE